MKLIEVSRTVSGGNYSNVSAKAQVEEGDTVEKVALELDKQLRVALNKIDERIEQIDTVRRDRTQAVRYIEDALEYAKRQGDLPF